MNPVLSRGHGLFNRDLLALVGSVETWVSQDQKTAASRISFKVLIIYQYVLGYSRDLNSLLNAGAIR